MIVLSTVAIVIIREKNIARIFLKRKGEKILSAIQYIQLTDALTYVPTHYF